jgi:hypothetical protein
MTITTTEITIKKRTDATLMAMVTDRRVRTGRYVRWSRAVGWRCSCEKRTACDHIAAVWSLTSREPDDHRDHNHHGRTDTALMVTVRDTTGSVADVRKVGGRRLVLLVPLGHSR